MKTKRTIAIITLKLLKGILPERYSFTPVIRPNLYGWEGQHFYFARHIFIRGDHVKGLKKLVYRAKHRKLYCTYKGKSDADYTALATQKADKQILKEVRETIKIEN